MRALLGATGLSLNIYKEDKDKKRLECVLDEGKKPKVILQIKEYVDNKGLMEAPGFHMQAIPPKTGLIKSNKIYVYLSEKVWSDLINKRDEEFKEGGFFCSRCKYDRFHINYYPEI